MPSLYQEALVASEGIAAPSPIDPSQRVSLRVDPTVMKKLSELRATTQILQFFYNICGCLPPVNNIGFHERDCVVEFPDHSKGIQDTLAVFQGLKRPCNDDGEDKLVFVYVTKPNYYYKFLPDMTCCAKRHSAPPKTVFAIYVKFDDESLTAGEIIQWEIVVADSAEPNYPQEFSERYDAKRGPK